MNKKIKKTIIGFIGDHNVGKTTASNVLKKHGFFKASINDKVEEFAKHLFPDNNWLNDKNHVLNEVRKRGYKQCKEYWMNLILISVPDDKNFIVFDDLSISEYESNKISVYQIYRPEVSSIELPDIETIVNDSDIKSFIEKIENLHKKITKNS